MGTNLREMNANDSTRVCVQLVEIASMTTVVLTVANLDTELRDVERELLNKVMVVHGHLPTKIK